MKLALAKIIKWSAIVSLMVGTLPQSALDYSLISKYIVVGASLVVFAQACALRRYLWMTLFLAIACAFNPVFPVLLSTYFWGVMRTFAALFFFFSLELLKPRTPDLHNSNRSSYI